MQKRRPSVRGSSTETSRGFGWSKADGWRRQLIGFGGAVLLGFAGDSMGQVISIPDPELQAAIRSALQKPTGDITAADMESLTNLYVEGLGTRNFEGLGAARNLTTLSLNGCSSATPPEVTCNFLTDVILPDGLVSLSILNLANNQ